MERVKFDSSVKKNRKKIYIVHNIMNKKQLEWMEGLVHWVYCGICQSVHYVEMAVIVRVRIETA